MRKACLDSPQGKLNVVLNVVSATTSNHYTTTTQQMSSRKCKNFAQKINSQKFVFCAIFLLTNYKKCVIIKSEKRKGSQPARVKNMYELIINGRTIYTTTNKDDAQMGAMFDFYKANKELMNIKEIIILNATENFFFEA